LATTAGFTAVFAAVFATGAFEADGFDPAAFATVLFLDGIALLLFEDFAAAAFLGSFTDALARPLDALRLAAAAFLFFEALGLRVFCDTACAWEMATPLFDGF
jgi:hypothetical protein